MGCEPKNKHNDGDAWKNPNGRTNECAYLAPVQAQDQQFNG
jgi:environmental stress-induced protein Ves